MYHRLFRPLALITLVATCLFGGGATTRAVVAEPTVIATVSQDSDPGIAMPRTDGRTVVWQETRLEETGVERDIKTADLATREVRTIASFPSEYGDGSPDVSGDVIVWSERGDIVGLNRRTAERLAIAATDAAETAPAISGNWVVWLSRNGDNWAVMARNIATMAAPTTLAERTVPVQPPFSPVFRMGAPLIDGTRVVWLESTKHDLRVEQRYDWQLLTCYVDACTPQTAAEGSDAPESAFPISVDVAGDFLVYATGTDGRHGRPSVVIMDLSNGSSRVLVQQALWVDFVTTDGHYVFWEYHEEYVSGPYMWGHDLYTGSTFPAVTSRDADVSPHTAGGMLVWSRLSSTTGSMAILAVPVTATLPTVSQPDPSATSSDWIYFPETGHYLAYSFKTFWEQSGGLPAFGYPLTEEFEEPNPDSGQILTVQYLERQRFEWHPEHAGTPYAVELGRLGAADAARRGLVATAPFQPLPPETGSDAACTFVPETGHRLCHGFRAFWAGHGLELGDPGISERESLALFGYPLSEEYVDPATGLVTQYFERARFEYHPDNPEPYRILLGRLGAEELATKGW